MECGRQRTCHLPSTMILIAYAPAYASYTGLPSPPIGHMNNCAICSANHVIAQLRMNGRSVLATFDDHILPSLPAWKPDLPPST